MSVVLPDWLARDVLRHYPPDLAVGTLTALGNRGGFSGARLWQIASAAGPLCLRAWPPGQSTPARLEWIHGLMASARQAGLAFVPRVVASQRGVTWVQQEERLWEVTTWQPGRADFRDQPTRTRLEAACTALARLHVAWANASGTLGPCPAVRRRLERARGWAQLVQTGWQPPFLDERLDPVLPWAQRVWPLLRTQADWVLRVLAPHADWSVPLQPCLCDIWHDHVLFAGDQVTGVVDYGGVALDHVATDLARLLGSLVGNHACLWADGLSSYTGLRLLSWEEERLVRVLDETGTFLGAVNWLTWLYWEGRQFEDRGAVAQRLAALVERLEGLRF